MVSLAVDATPYRGRRGTFLTRWLGFVARATLALLALWTLHLAQNRFGSFQQDYASTFHWDVLLWLGWIGTSAGAGFLFGVATFLPFSRVRFLWSSDLGTQFALAVLAGVAIASGFRAKSPEPDRNSPERFGSDT